MRRPRPGPLTGRVYRNVTYRPEAVPVAQVRVCRMGLVTHAIAGPLSFGVESVIGPNDPDQRLVVYTVEPDSPTARVLPLLANWATAPAWREPVSRH